MNTPQEPQTPETGDKEKTVKGYGAWRSPIDGEYLAKSGKGPAELAYDQSSYWWGEARSDEGGRCAMMRQNAATETAKPVEITPPDANVRTRVHEYGGGAFSVKNDVLYYSDDSDARLRRIDTKKGYGADAQVELLSPEPENKRSLRYADGNPSPNQKWYVCVREKHNGPSAQDVLNEVVAVALDGSMSVKVLATGADFYTSPRVSPCGTKLCWIQWQHPDMSWDKSQLWTAELDEENATTTNPTLVAGAAQPESIMACNYSSDGDLLAVSDRDEWWNLYRFDPETPEETEPVVSGSFELVNPGWVFGAQRWAEIDGVIVTAAGDPGGDTVITTGPNPERLDKWTTISSLVAAGDSVIFHGATHNAGTELVKYKPGHEPQIIRPAKPAFDTGYFPDPTHIAFPTAEGQEAYGWFYAPANPNFKAPETELPPLLVLAHGGPTSRARTKLQMALRYWTSRGFAVVDVDYRGSTGYGRTYRQGLNKKWGIADVEDACAAAEYLAEKGLVDSERIVIKGGSAGGLTVLGALCDSDIFAAGASRYGVADLSGLAAETHKFESRYTDGLVAPWPEALDVYEARSPINRISQLDTPMIVLQGGQDVIVPPNQSEAIVDALADRGVTHSYLYFPDEGHGFRSADAQVTALEGELAFFCHVLGIAEADTIELDIKNPGLL